MVVCSAPLLPLAQAACPVTPAGPYPFTPGLCRLSPVPTIPFNQRYPPPTIFTNGPILTTTTSAPIPCAPPVSTPPAMRGSYPPSPLTPNSIDSSSSEFSNTSSNSAVPSNCNTIFTYTPVPTNLVSVTNAMVPYTTTVVQCKVPNNLTTTNSNLSASNPGVFPTFPSNAIVPCQQRIVNGPSVLQCTPGVCQITPTAVFSNGTLEMCHIPPSSMLSSSPIFPVPPVSISQNLGTAAAVSSWKQSYGMEQVWQCEFRTLFQQYAPHAWMLLPVNTKPSPSGIWHANVDSAKVRFCCEDCGHGWTSMKGRVAFWFVLNPITNEGVVCLKLYGQQCDRCKTGNYEPAMWYPEEVTKVLVNIYNRVGQVYYGFQQAPYHKARRPGKPRTPHNSELCQACKDGVCSERR